MKKFVWTSYCEYEGNEYRTTTKVFADIPQAAVDAIGKNEKWDGCHWDHPALVFTEQVWGTTMSEECSELIDMLGAVPAEEADENRCTCST